LSGVRFDVLQDLASADRDLGSVDLWEKSLYRSRQRRRLTEVGRKSRRRRKSASLATTAALVAVPVVPQTLAAADVPGSNPSVAGAVDGKTLSAAAQRIVLQEGSQGGLVTALQTRLNEVLPLTHIAVDGIYGPQTRGAVVDFQRRQGLTASGVVDARAWAVLFKAPVLVFGTRASAGSGSSNGSAPPSGANARSSAAVGKASAAVGNGSGAAGKGSGAVSKGSRAIGNVSHASRAPATGGENKGSVIATSKESRHLGGPGTVTPDASQASDSSGSSSTGGPPEQATPPNDNAAPTPSGDSGSSNAGKGRGGAPPVTVVAPPSPPKQTSTYVLTSGVALPLPRQYLTGGSVDQGVDYAAPGGTPEYAMGDGVIIGEGISGFGPNAPILKITDGPLKGMEIYYGHAGPNLVHVGQQVHAGQQITITGYGIVGISTGPHLEVGFYPPGSMGTGSRMLSLINSIMSQHPSGRAWGANGQILAHTTRRGARVAIAKKTRRSYVGYTGTGGGGASAAQTAVTSGAPAAVTSTVPAAVPAAAPAAPAPAVAPTESAEPAAAPEAASPAADTPAAAAPVSAAPEATQSAPVESAQPAAPVESAQPAPTGESAVSGTPVDSAPAQAAPTTDPAAGGGGGSSTTPGGSSGASTATTPSAPAQTTSTAQAPASQAPSGVSSVQPQQDAASGPAQTGPASAATESASAAAPAATASKAPVEPTSHSDAAPSGTDGAPSQSGPAHASAASGR
jgi:peptidoglycan hydrolase-like protein with peptidoglycan-binding domain